MLFAGQNYVVFLIDTRPMYASIFGERQAHNYQEKLQ